MKVRILGKGVIYNESIDTLIRLGHEIVQDVAGCDVLLLANYTKILRSAVFSLPTIGTLCFHPSILPKHRGRDAVYWTVKHGDPEAGVTWFWVDEGIDTGPIAIQGSVIIDASYSPRQLYEEHLVPLGLSLLAEVLPVIKQGPFPATVQDHTKATYDPPRQKLAAK